MNISIFKNLKWLFIDQFMFWGSSGGGGGTQQSTGTTYNTNIPEYARPYVENMLGATQSQLFTMGGGTPEITRQVQTGTNEDGTPIYETQVTPATGQQITGFKPYQPYSTNVEDYVAGFQPLQESAMRATGQLQVPGQFGTATDLANQAGYGSLGAQQNANMLGTEALGYGQAGSMYGGMGAQQAMQTAQQTGRQAGMYGGMGSMYGQQAANMAQQGYGAGAQFAQQATDPGSVQAYMSPYMQNVVDYQKTQALRDYQIGQQGRKAQSVGQGAFGGSRQAIMEAEAQRNLSSQLGGIEAQGAQDAFKNAQAQQQFGAQLGLQGLQAGYQGTGMGIQGAQTGLQGVGAQQAAGQLGLQGTAQGIQGAQTGLQGVQGAVGAGQYGLAGLGQAGQAASTLGTLGGQQLGAQKDIISTQYQMGAQQQAAEQQKINQAIQDWANTQQYPLMQLGVMSNMLRGLPMQSATTNQYVAAPNSVTQGIGLAGAGASILSALKAKGGIIKEKKMASGGITGYNIGGEAKSDLYDMPLDRLQKEAQESPSESIRNMAKSIIKERTGKAGGGIIAFQNRGLVPEVDKEDPAMVRQAYIDAAQGQNLPVFDKSEPYKPSDRHVPLTERAGRALGIRNAGREVPTKETTTMPMRSDGSDVPYVAGEKMPSVAPTAQPSGIKAAQRMDSDVPTVVGAPAKVPTAAPSGPTQAERDAFYIKEKAPADKAPAAKPAPAADNKGVGLVPNEGLAPNIGGIKFPTAPVEETEAQLAKGAAERTASFGIDEGRQKARANSMAELANAKDEARRTTALRMAEFFGAWGSTPGNTIVAGLNALKNKVPDFITDMKEETKIRKAINKDIAELDKLDREEEKGIKKDYFAERMKLADRAMHKYGYELTAASSRYASDSSVRAAGIRASAAGSSKDDLANLQGRLNSANENIRKWEDNNASLVRKANRQNPKKDPDLQKSIDAAKKQLETNEQYQNLKADRDAIRRVIGANPRVQSTSEGDTEKPSTAAPAGPGKLVQNKDGTFTYQR